MSSNLVVRGGRAARSVATALTCFVAMLLMASVPAHAQILWSASSGDWSVGPNWSGGLVPTSTSNVWIANGGTANITQLGETCGTLSLGSSAGSGSTQMSGGSLSVISYEYVGNSGAGTFTVSTGTDSTSVLTIGNNAGSVVHLILPATAVCPQGTRPWALRARRVSRNPAERAASQT